MIAFLLPALILPSTALAPPVLTWPDSRLAAAPAPGSPEPALPTTIGTSTAWTRDVGSGMLDIVAGARGPVILTEDGVEGLDPDDGSILWSYHRRYTSYREIHSPLTRGGVLERNNMRYLLASPDRRHVALRAITSTTDITIILDTSTGKATAEEPCEHDDALQLTDSAALIEDKAISLADGKTLWTLPDGRGSTHRIYNGTAATPPSSSTAAPAMLTGALRPSLWRRTPTRQGPPAFRESRSTHGWRSPAARAWTTPPASR